MGGDHHHHHAPKIEIPDYRIYKVENVPELKQLQESLAAKGLKDPWLRNEVWRYDPKEFSTMGHRTKTLFLRGMKWGLVAAVLTVVAEKAYDAAFPSSHDHHHAEHH